MDPASPSFLLLPRVRLARYWAVFFAVTQTLAFPLLLWAAGLWFLAWVDVYGGMRVEFQRLGWLLMTGAGLLLACLQRPRRSLSLSSVALSLGRGQSPSDLFQTAVELHRAGTRGPFVERLWRQLPILPPREVCRRVSPIGSAQRLVSGGVGVLLLLLLPVGVKNFRRIVWPFGPDQIPGLLAVNPGMTRVARGSTVIVTAEFDTSPAEVPWLWIKTKTQSWGGRPMEWGTGTQLTSVLETVRDTVEYRISLGGHRTRRYVLTPFDPPRLASFQVEIDPPGYTGQVSSRSENPFAPEAWVGSTLTFSGTWEGSVISFHLADEGGPLVPVTPPGPRFQWREIVTGAGRRRMWASTEDSGSASFSPVGDIDISIKEDRPPEIHWRVPSEDFRASPTDDVSVLYDIQDDLGVKEVFLEFSVNDERPERRLWQRFSIGSSDANAGQWDHLWRLAPMGLKGGDVVVARLVARDHRLGGGEGVSESRTLRVVSYVQDRNDITQSLTAFQQALQQRWVEQLSIGKSSATTLSERTMAAVQQKSMGALLAKDEHLLSDALDRMEQNPLFDEESLDEYRMIESDLRDVFSASVPAAAESLRLGDARPAQELASTLDRLSTLSQKALQRHRGQELMSSSEDLAHQAESAVETLSGALSDAERRMLVRALETMGQTLNALSETMRSLSAPLSEDFLRETNASSLRLDEIQSQIETLRSALSRGDTAGALSAAQTLAKMLREMETALRRAGQSTWGSDPALEALVQQLNDRSERLAQRQEALLQSARTVFSLWIERRLSRQRLFLERVPNWKESVDALRMAWEKESTVPPVGQVEIVVASARLDAAVHSSGAAPTLTSDLREAESALRSLSFRLREAQLSLLRGPTGERLSPEALTFEAQNKYNAWDGLGRGGLALADEIAHGLSLDQTPESADLHPSEVETLRSVSEGQSGLAEETRRFVDDLAVPAGKTALVSDATLRRFRDAADWMVGAVSSFHEQQVSRGIQHQEKALERLREGSQSLSQARQMLAVRGTLGSTPGGRVGRRMSLGGTGSAGTGAVRLPTPETFRPPEDFRKELKDLMKERVPSTYEKIIREYYRHWSK